MNALALQVVVPLLSAPLCLLVRSAGFARLLAAASGLFGLGNAIWLLVAVRDGGPLRHAYGGFVPPIGIEHRLDLTGAYMLVVIATIVAATTAWAAITRLDELGRSRRDLFFAAWQMCVAGLYGMTLTADVFNVFVFLEIASLSTYVLIAHGSERRALVASFRYLLMGTVGATFLLIGIGLLYAMTGTLNMHDLAVRLQGTSHTSSVRTALAFVSVGLWLKAAIFPLHLWLPSAYACAPAAVSALLAGTATKVAFYLWLRFFFTAFAPTFALDDLPVAKLLLALGLVGAVAGSLIAVFQDEPKRMLAWSSIAQIGYLIAGLSLATAAGVAASLSHIASHALVKSALFLALGGAIAALGANGRPLRLHDLRGLSRRMPLTAAAILVAGLGLIGVPLTSGFVSKWLLVDALLAADQWFAAVVVLGTSLLAVVYVGRLVGAVFGSADDAPPPAARVGLGAAAVVVVLCLLSIALGIFTSFNVDLAAQAADELLGVTGSGK